MMRKYWFMLLSAIFVASGGYADSFRGMPYYVKVTSVNLKQVARAPDVNAEVCYQFATTTPIFDYSDLASNVLSGTPVHMMPPPRYGEHGDAQEVGIPFQLQIFGFAIYAYVNSNAAQFDLRTMSFFNSVVRATAGVPKPLRQIAYATHHRGMIFPQYEWVNVCETIAFGNAYSDEYIRRLFNGPGPIGHLNGRAQFSFNLFPPSFLGIRPISLALNGAHYAVPIFGMSTLSAGDLRMISLSHFINSLNTLKANLDESLVNSFLAENRGIVDLFEQQYRLKVALPIDAEGIVHVLHQVAAIENPHAN